MILAIVNFDEIIKFRTIIGGLVQACLFFLAIKSASAYAALKSKLHVYCTSFASALAEKVPI